MYQQPPINMANGLYMKLSARLQSKESPKNVQLTEKETKYELQGMNEHPMKAQVKDILKFGPMWHTKYASAVPKNLGVGVNYWPCSEGYFLSGRP